MVCSSPLFFSFLLCIPLFFCCNSANAIRPNAIRNSEGSEQWGYVQVRPKAHMFWWLYQSPQRVDNGSTPWPTVLWLQGGPGASGVGIGNFEEVGPLDTDLKPRNSTWLQKADLLFVDNPVGTGYSFVEDQSALVKTDEDAATDLTTLLKALYNSNLKLQSSPLFVVAESYGGKYAVTLGLSIVKAIKAGELKLKFGGVALGDSWISPEDFVFSWAPLLRDVSRLEINGAEKANSLAEQIKQQIANGQYSQATDTWNELENVISASSNSVDFYNFLLDSNQDPVSTAAVAVAMGTSMNRYSRYLSSKPSSNGDINELMNGVIKQKLKKSEPSITKCKEKENWTKVSFKPDLAKFNMTHLEDDVVALMKKRVVDLAGTLGKGVKVELNGTRVPVKTFADLFLQSANKTREQPLPRISILVKFVLDEMGIPVINLEELNGKRRNETMSQLHEACANWGFFWVENHGISKVLMEKVTELVNQHYEESLKERFYESELARGLGSQPHSEISDLDWESSFFIRHHPNPNYDDIVNHDKKLGEAMKEYVEQLIRLAETLAEAMSENLGLEKKYIKKAFSEPSVGTKVAVYPQCSNPELVIGLRAHTDAGGIILLLQDDTVPGLEFFKDGDWVPITPTKKNRVFVNLGDQLEVVSNGIYKSVLHRVLADKDGSRLSIATFYNPGANAIISPAPKLSYPSGYCFQDYLHFYSKTKFSDKEARFQTFKEMNK